MQQQVVYLDYNGTTPLADSVKSTMISAMENYGNPSAQYILGREAKKVVEDARQNVANVIGAGEDSSQILFTSGGTESNNLAIIGSCLRMKKKFSARDVIVISDVEHPAVLEPVSYLERSHGFQVRRISVDSDGIILMKELESLLEKEAGKIAFVSIMHSNNEIGSIQPIAEISEKLKAKDPRIVFHTDAAQSIGKVNISVEELNVDLLTIVAHKLYAPKGVGALYIKKGVELERFCNFGAGQENFKRAGTENTILIAGLGEACRLIYQDRLKHIPTIIELRELLYKLFSERVKGEYLKRNSPISQEKCLPNVLSLSFKGLLSHEILLTLKDKLAVSAGASCHAIKEDCPDPDAIKISKVLQAINLPEEFAKGTIRFSLGNPTTKKDIFDAVDIFLSDLQRRTPEAMIQ